LVAVVLQSTTMTRSDFMVDRETGRQGNKVAVNLDDFDE